jgi:hypothetical protein
MATNTCESGRTGDSAGFATMRRLLGTGTRMGNVVFARLHALAFWSAVVLPWGLLAALFLGVASQYPGSFTALLSANLLCVVTGYRHGPSRRQELARSE